LDVVDVGKVTDTASHLLDVVVARQNTFMCFDPGRQMIIEDIVKEGLNRVVVAACSPSLHAPSLCSFRSWVPAHAEPYAEGQLPQARIRRSVAVAL